MKLGIDTGGTFTDFILQTDEGIATYKVSSTPDDPGRAILAGLLHFFPQNKKQATFALPDNLEIVHGTTVGTNAFLQRKGARTLLVTTYGFEDVLTIGRQNRQTLYDLEISRPAEILCRDFCVGVKERVLFDGTVQVPLGKSVGKRIRSLCRKLSIESVAICLLHSYANPDHEKDIASALFPLGIPVSVSSEVLPEFREYERFSTTVINAYLAPVISSYIDSLQSKLGSHPLYIQQSNGGILPAKFIGKRAVHTVLSGPAGGVHGAFHLARQMDLPQIITFDMGGTSTDVSLCDHEPTLTRDYHIDSFPVRVQVMDIHTVGAGGGSIVRLDEAGLMHVGPQSAGAEPGPVCYGKGENLTVTDANLYLGRLIAKRFLGGEMSLFPDAVNDRMQSYADKLGMTADEVALGIIRLVNVGMAKAIRTVSLERGYDPKDFALFSFGGASGLHCCELAAELGIAEIVVPARAGILSAQGMVMADPTLDGSSSLFLKGDEINQSVLDSSFDMLIEAKKKEIQHLCSSGEISVRKFVDMRYEGQAYEISVPYDEHFMTKFHELHSHSFGYSLSDCPLEIVSIRCTVMVNRPKQLLPVQETPVHGKAIPAMRTSVLFQDGWNKAAVYFRHDLQYGHSLIGPAIISDNYTTILLPSHFSLTVDSFLNLIISVN